MRWPHSPAGHFSLVLRTAGLLLVTAGSILQLTAGAVSAQTVQPVGSRFLVNTFNYGGWQQSPAVAGDQDGNSVVVWRTFDGRAWWIHGQRYDATGARLGAEFPINTNSTDFASDTTIDKTASAGLAIGADHTFVVVWADPGPTRPGIIARRFDVLTGTALTPELVVSTAPLGKFPSVAIGANGSFIVVWLDAQPAATDGTLPVMGQRYSSAGLPLGSAFVVGSSPDEPYTAAGSSYRGYEYIRPRVGADAAGKFVVVWRSTFAGTRFIAGRQYDADGNAGAQFTIDADTADRRLTQPTVAVAPAGEFVVAWTSYPSWVVPSPWTTWGGNIVARLYASSGAAAAPVFQVNSGNAPLGESGLQPAVAMDATGKFTIVWSFPAEGYYGGIVARSYTPEGSPFSGQTAIDAVGGDYQPAVAATVAGNFVSVWCLPVSSVGSIYGQRVKIPADLKVSAFTVPARAASGATVALTATIFNQGGDAAAPSATQIRWSTTTTPAGTDPVLATVAIGALNPGQAQTVSVSVTLPVVDAGAYYLTAVSDALDAVVEADETNNMLARRILIGPDLIAASLSVSVASPGLYPWRGTAITIRDTVQNVGGGTAASSLVAYVLSGDPTATTADTLLATRIAGPLAGSTLACSVRPDSCSAGSVTVTLPASLVPGRTYYIIAVADATNAVAEVNESNNARAVPFTIY